MRAFLCFAFILFVYYSFGQTKECYCNKDSLLNQATTNCKTTVLKNGAKLYWQFNCNKIWLTLEQKSGRKTILDTVSIDFYAYTFRLGYHLFKEYEESLLFRSGCPANGPCNFVLLDKTNGKKLKEFGELIYDHETKTIYDFILYLSSKDILVLHYIDTDRKYSIKIESNQINSVLPEYMFNTISIDNNILALSYGTKTILLDLRKYSR